MRTAMQNGNAVEYLYDFYRKEKAWPSPGASRERGGVSTGFRPGRTGSDRFLSA